MSTHALPPGPPKLPLLGHMPWVLGDPLRFFSKLGRDYGDIATFHIGRRRSVFINSPALIERVVRDRTLFRSDPTRRAMASFLGNGLLSLEDTSHMRHRRLMQPAFHKQRIARYGAIMAQEAQRALDVYQSGETRDIRADMMELTLAIVSRALFDTDARDDSQEIGHALERVTPWVVRGARMAGLLPEGRALPYPRQTRAAIARLQHIVRKIVAARRADGGDHGDLLSMLLAARDEDGSALSDEDVCAEALTILLAGHETTALTLTWAWHLLTRHPDVQEALAREVATEVGARAVSADDLPKLPLALQVVRETLRLYPPAWVGDRVPQGELELAGYTIPANTIIVFSVYVTHRDARFFAEPERFDPARFSPARSADIPSGAYLPFGAGVHLCIGNAFALMEAQLVLAAMAQRFRFTALPGHRVRARPLITLGMADPFPVRVEARTGTARSTATSMQDASR